MKFAIAVLALFISVDCALARSRSIFKPESVKALGTCLEKAFACVQLKTSPAAFPPPPATERTYQT